MAHSLTTCTFCGVGCGLYLETAANHIAGVYPSMSHPANKGKICIRGWHVHEVTSSPDRLKAPLLKKNGQFQEVTWEEALAFIASRLKEIKAQSGPDSIALLNSPRCSNEESYLLQKLARAVIGTNNVDHGAGVYTNNSVNVLLDMIGVPATTSSIEDLEKSDVIVVDGVDLARQLPTIGGHVIRTKLAGAKPYSDTKFYIDSTDKKGNHVVMITDLPSQMISLLVPEKKIYSLIRTDQMPGGKAGRVEAV